jgi:hypothetical protein
MSEKNSRHVCGLAKASRLTLLTCALQRLKKKVSSHELLAGLLGHDALEGGAEFVLLLHLGSCKVGMQDVQHQAVPLLPNLLAFKL